MNERKHSKVISYFDEKIAACKEEAAALQRDDRQDEAVFAKVRMNVYDIFRTVFKVAVNNAEADAFFLERLDQIPQNWHTSLVLARQHGDGKKAHIEQIKLDTAAEIRMSFAEIREVSE